MRRHSLAPHVALALALGLAATLVSAQQSATAQPDDDGAVRGAFRNTRSGANGAVKKDANAQNDSSERAKTAAKPHDGRHGGGGKKESLAKADKANGSPVELKATAPSAAGPLLSHAAADADKPPGIALGYTLFMRAPTGEAKRVSATREFKSGDAVRILIETNTDGYLYIFNAENDGDALMIFPNAKLQRGANFIRAHVPYEIPSSTEADENLRWLSFDDRPATERVYFIVARKPLEDVPAGEVLVRWCAETGSDACAWSPKAKHWDEIKKWAKRREQVATSRAADEGRAETPAEHEAATRGLGLPADAPLPSVIYMITSASADVLVATVDLIHR